ncbi:MAG: hypothetical protein J6C96_09690 [Oscillospiraceae bacterium]|nr:hypothetical protein [Oscillospiraceae bacterium]
MDIEKVFAMFRLFYTEEDGDSFLPVAEMAAEYVKSRALDDTSASDPRLCCLAAAHTLCRVLEIKAARERLTLTRGGAAATEPDFRGRIEFAQRLYHGYEQLCAGLIRDDGFLFLRME